MSNDAPLKSAYELAMERLREQDREAGVEEKRPLSEEQKQRIGEARQTAKAELAELEILKNKKRTELAGDEAKLLEMEEHDAIDRKRIDSRLETDIRKIRGEGV